MIDIAYLTEQLTVYDGYNEVSDGVHIRGSILDRDWYVARSCRLFFTCSSIFIRKKNKKNTSAVCEIEEFVEIHLCKLRY